VTPDGPGAVLMLGGRARPRPNLFATKRA
jgi:hypothetical protein